MEVGDGGGRSRGRSAQLEEEARASTGELGYRPACSLAGGAPAPGHSRGARSLASRGKNWSPVAAGAPHRGPMAAH